MRTFDRLTRQFSHNALRIWNPGPKGHGHEEPWHAALAGAASGLAVLAEKRERRIAYGQQLLVRGLQGAYNMMRSRGWVHIAHGDILLCTCRLARS